MKPRDLQYPEDARHVHDALVHGLEYDAAVAVLADRLSRIPQDAELPKSTVVFRFGQEAENTVRRELAGLCSRFATISMISRFDRANNALLLQRRFLEYLIRKRVKRMPGQELFLVMKNVSKELRRHSPVQVVMGLLVEHPSPELKDRSRWLADIHRVRNCLAHREGLVQLEDTKGEDVLRVCWLSMKATINGKELVKVPYTVQSQGNLKVFFDETHRAWRIGEAVHLNASDCQDMAFSLAVVEGQVLREFEHEMNSLIRANGAQL